MTQQAAVVVDRTGSLPPPRITNLIAVPIEEVGSIYATWTLSPPNPSESFEVSYKKKNSSTSDRTNCHRSNSCMLTRGKHRIEPLNEYEITVRATSSDAVASFSVFVGTL